MEKKKIGYKTYFAIPHVSQGGTFWESLEQIEKWGKNQKFKSFRADSKLFLIKDEQIVVYSKIIRSEEIKNGRKKENRNN